MFVRNQDGLALDIGGVIDKLEHENILQYQINADLLRLFYKHNNWNFSLLFTEKMNTKFSYRKDLLSLMWYGNAPFVGDTLQFAPNINANYYRELSGVVAYEFEKLSVGFRPKLLVGMANISSQQNRMDLFTNENDYAIYLSGSYKLNTSRVDDFLANPWQASLRGKNLGYAFDAGINYKWNDKIELSASVNNVGRIHWQDDVRNYANSGEFSFGGINLNEYLLSDSIGYSYLADTLKTTFLPIESNSPYYSNLVPRAYANVMWNPAESYAFGLLTFIEFFDKPRPVFSLFASKQLTSWLNVGSTVSYKNNRLNNWGTSIIVTQRLFQFYFLSDNIIGTIDWRNSRNVNFRTGINFVFR
jgi:hypothetical protein